MKTHQASWAWWWRLLVIPALRNKRQAGGIMSSPAWASYCGKPASIMAERNSSDTESCNEGETAPHVTECDRTQDVKLRVAREASGREDNIMRGTVEQRWGTRNTPRCLQEQLNLDCGGRNGSHLMRSRHPCALVPKLTQPQTSFIAWKHGEVCGQPFTVSSLA